MKFLFRKLVADILREKIPFCGYLEQKSYIYIYRNEETYGANVTEDHIH